MNAVVRLNLLVTTVFVIALVITLKSMLDQASKDIGREISAGLSFTHQLLNAAVKDEALLEQLLAGETRHVSLTLINPAEPIANPQSLPIETEAGEMIPLWFPELIPGLNALQEKQFYRYLPDGRALMLQADPSDELEEVWESVQDVLMLFLLSALLSNLMIYLGITRGIKPVSDFLEALNDIEKGHYNARLKKYSIKEINELSSHFNSMAHAIECAENENKRLTHELIRLQETERSHLARELHDDLGQYLTGIRAQAFLIKESSHIPELVASVGNQIAINCDAMQTSFRQLIRELHPVILEQLGLVEAIKTQLESWKQTHHQIDVKCELPESTPSLNDETNTHIYRIVQEALNNIAQHAKADEVELLINIDTPSKTFTLIITDNGQKRSSPEKSGLGLRSMKERALCMDGELVYEQQNDGTTITLTIPYSE